MDALTSINPVIVSAPQPSSATVQGNTQTALPTPSSQSEAANTQGFDVQAAEQQRLQAVQKMSQDVANVYVLGDQKFTIFKDVTGQYITRYTSLRDGKVTYVPEPTLVKLTNTDSSQSLDVKV